MFLRHKPLKENCGPGPIYNPHFLSEYRVQTANLGMSGGRAFPPKQGKEMSVPGPGAYPGAGDSVEKTSKVSLYFGHLLCGKILEYSPTGLSPRVGGADSAPNSHPSTLDPQLASAAQIRHHQGPSFGSSKRKFTFIKNEVETGQVPGPGHYSQTTPRGNWSKGGYHFGSSQRHDFTLA